MKPFITQSALLCAVLLPILLCIEPVLSSSAAGQETLIGIVGHDFIMLGADSSRSSSITVTSSNVDKIKILADPFPNKYRRGIEYTTNHQQAIAVSCAGDAADCDRLIGTLTKHVSMMEFESSIGCDVKNVYHGRREAIQLTKSAGLDAEAVARLARGEIASSLRSRGRLNTCLIVAGMVRCYDSLPFSKESLSSDKNEMGPKNKEGQSNFSNRIRHQIETARIEYNGSDKTQTNEEGMISASTKNTKLVKHGDSLQPKLYWLDEYGSIQAMEYCAHGLGSNFALSILDRGYHPNMSKGEAAALIRNCFDQLRKRFVINCPEPPCIKCVDQDGVSMLSDGIES